MSVEYLFIISGIFIILASYGAFVITVANFGLASSVFWIFMAPISVFISTVVYVFLLPLYFIRGWNIWLVTAISVLIFSAIVSISSQFIWVSYTGDGQIHFFEVFGFVFGLYGLSHIFFNLINEPRLCFYKFKKCWQARALELSIPVQIRGELISIAAQNQMVKITTSRGYHIMRESLTNAIKRVHNTEGLKVHRSYWVAKPAIRKLDRQAGRNIIVLSNGQQIPVSDKKISDVKELLS